jgi:hypothetical protein
MRITVKQEDYEYYYVCNECKCNECFIRYVCQTEEHHDHSFVLTGKAYTDLLLFKTRLAGILKYQGNHSTKDYYSTDWRM